MSTPRPPVPRKPPRGRSPRRVVATIALAASLALGGCDESATEPDWWGTYQLVAVNGDAPPALIHTAEEEGDTLEVRIVEGTLTLEDREYRSELVLDVTLGGQPVPVDPVRASGSYSLESNALVLFAADGSVDATGLLQSDEISVQDSHPEYGQFTLVFRK